MRLVVNLGEALEIEVRVDLGGSQVGMAKQFLYRAQIAAGFQHMGRTGVAQGVRVQAAVQPVFNRPAPQALLYAAGADAGPAAVDEQRRFPVRAVLGSGIQPRAQDRGGLLTNRHDTGLASLADYPRLAAAKIEVLQVESDQLGQAQRRRIHQFHHGEIALIQPVIGVAVQQLLDTVDIQAVREPVRRLGGADILSRVAGELSAFDQEATKAAQR